MLTLIKRVLAAAIVIAAVAAPTAAYARSIGHPIGATEVPVTSPTTTTAHLAGPPRRHAPPRAFAGPMPGSGPGSLLVLIGVGGAAAVAYRRRVHPLAS